MDTEKLKKQNVTLKEKLAESEVRNIRVITMLPHLLKMQQILIEKNYDPLVVLNDDTFEIELRCEDNSVVINYSNLTCSVDKVLKKPLKKYLSLLYESGPFEFYD